jgi:hypothetical protein
MYCRHRTPVSEAAVMAERAKMPRVQNVFSTLLGPIQRGAIQRKEMRCYSIIN